MAQDTNQDQFNQKRPKNKTWSYMKEETEKIILITTRDRKSVIKTIITPLKPKTTWTGVRPNIFKLIN